MLRPTDSLCLDHQLVARALKSLQAIAAAIRRGDEFPVADCTLLLRFLREFVFAVHMRKEHEVVYPAAALRGGDDDAALVGDLMRLHDEAAELLHTLVLFWEPVGELTLDERRGFADTVDATVARIVRMQQLEEEQLFPALATVVPADDLLDWAQQFDALEHERTSRQAWAPAIGALATRWRC